MSDVELCIHLLLQAEPPRHLQQLAVHFSPLLLERGHLVLELLNGYVEAGLVSLRVGDVLRHCLHLVEDECLVGVDLLDLRDVPAEVAVDDLLVRPVFGMVLLETVSPEVLEVEFTWLPTVLVFLNPLLDDVGAALLQPLLVDVLEVPEDGGDVGDEDRVLALDLVLPAGYNVHLEVDLSVYNEEPDGGHHEEQVEEGTPLELLLPCGFVGRGGQQQYVQALAAGLVVGFSDALVALQVGVHVVQPGDREVQQHEEDCHPDEGEGENYPRGTVLVLQMGVKGQFHVPDLHVATGTRLEKVPLDGPELVGCLMCECEFNPAWELVGDGQLDLLCLDVFVEDWLPPRRGVERGGFMVVHPDGIGSCLLLSRILS